MVLAWSHDTELPDVRKWTSYVKPFGSYRITTRECVHLVTRGHFRSRDKGGGHTFNPPQPKTHAARKRRNCVLYNQNYYTAGTGILLLWPWPDPMNFTYELDPYFLETYRMCENELRTSRLSKVIVLQTGRQTRPKLYTTPFRGWPIMMTRQVRYDCVWHSYVLNKALQRSYM